MSTPVAETNLCYFCFLYVNLIIAHSQNQNCFLHTGCQQVIILNPCNMHLFKCLIAHPLGIFLLSAPPAE